MTLDDLRISLLQKGEQIVCDTPEQCVAVLKFLSEEGYPMSGYAKDVVAGTRRLEEDFLNPGYHSDFALITCYSNDFAQGPHYTDIEHLLFGADDGDDMDDDAGAEIASGFAELFGMPIGGAI